MTRLKCKNDLEIIQVSFLIKQEHFVSTNTVHKLTEQLHDKTSNLGYALSED